MTLVSAQSSGCMDKTEVLPMINCSLSVVNPIIRAQNDTQVLKEWAKRRRIIKFCSRIVQNSESNEE